MSAKPETMEIEIAGRMFGIDALRYSDGAELLAWSRKRYLAEVIRLSENEPTEERWRQLENAFDYIARMKTNDPYIKTGAERDVETYAYQVWLMIRRKHSSLTLEQVTALLTEQD